MPELDYRRPSRAKKFDADAPVVNPGVVVQRFPAPPSRFAVADDFVGEFTREWKELRSE